MKNEPSSMGLTRREVLAAAGLSLAGVASPALAAEQSLPTAPKPPVARTLPDKASFAPLGMTYLDSGSHHPAPLGAVEAVKAYLFSASMDRRATYKLDNDGVRAKFARLINADPSEIAFIPNTMTGEQAVLRGLGLPASRGHIVTDTLHFFGSVPLHEEMRKQGADVTWVRARDGRIPFEEMKRAIRKGTTLVAVSSVSTINGFQHDMKALCEHAHANGALVYADIIHGAGCVPIDVKDWNVDFAASSSYKYLMGDFGLGFVYARKDVQDRLRRTEFGYYGLSKFDTHIYPYDPPGTVVAEYDWDRSAEGRFAHSTLAHGVAAHLDHSLEYILNLGVKNIQAHAKTLTDHLKEELPKLGYELMTPLESSAPNVACAYEGARTKLAKRLADANVRITVRANNFRATTSVFNDHSDIERLLAALGRA
jgi:selenocysteine lyase/cysteine desulfurase